MCFHSSIHRHLLWVLYGISIAFQCFFFLRTFHGLSMICHGCSLYFAWLFCGVTMCGFTDPFNPFPMSNDSSLLYSLLYRDYLYNISHAFHYIDINTRFTLLSLSLFSLLLNSFPSHFTTRDILILFTSSDDVLELYTGARKSYLNVEAISASLQIACVDLHGYSMAMLNPWCPMFHLCPMVSHGNTMEIYGNPMVFHGAQGHTHGVPWKIHGVQWKALGVPWKTQGTPWSIFVRVFYTV